MNTYLAKEESIGLLADLQRSSLNIGLNFFIWLEFFYQSQQTANSLAAASGQVDRAFPSVCATDRLPEFLRAGDLPGRVAGELQCHQELLDVLRVHLQGNRLPFLLRQFHFQRGLHDQVPSELHQEDFRAGGFRLRCAIQDFLHAVQFDWRTHRADSLVVFEQKSGEFDGSFRD
jgi:hypothetical protein